MPILDQPPKFGRRSLLKLAGAACVTTTVPLPTVAAAQTTEPVKIGVIIGLTGSAAVAGNDSYRAMQLGAEEVNEAGGVLGRPIKLIVEDDEGRPKSGVEAANKLADVDKVAACIGAYQSSIALPVGRLLNEKGVVWVTDATTNDLKTVGPYLFNVAGIAEQAVALVDFVKADKAGAKKLTGIFQNNPIGQDRAKVSEKRAKELGLEWIPALLYQPGATDFRTELQQVVNAGADAILTDIYDSDAPIIQRQLVELGMGDFSNTYSYNPGAYGTLEPNLIEGIKGLNYITGGIRAEAFNKKFLEKFGHIYTDAWGGPPFYDAVWIVATAINLANGLDRKKIRDAMWPAAYHYLGVSGNGDKGFNKWGMQASDQYEKLAYKAGKMVPLSKGPENIVVFRYSDDQGTPLSRAPSEEQNKQLYPDYKP
ncbi:MAG: ABC transporter substrate-binding protein [Methylobacteriaceae bacterium]|nr:ABC transporter substrate-binding protein [Methylobacteriaceae bacterium]